MLEEAGAEAMAAGAEADTAAEAGAGTPGQERTCLPVKTVVTLTIPLLTATGLVASVGKTTTPSPHADRILRTGQ